MNNSQKTVLVFGTFDGLHPGHIFFLESARKLGDRLVVVVARDEVVVRLKHKTPEYNESVRADKVACLSCADDVILGDSDDESWDVVRRIQPDIIATGHDQEELSRALRECAHTHDISLVGVPSHHPDVYSSTKLRVRK